MSRKTGQAGIDLIKRFEGCRLKAYQDSVGVWTIGYGHTKGVKRGQVITQEQADAFLRDDLGDAEAGVERVVKVPLTDNQFGALVSFTFNLGIGALSKSTLLRTLNGGDYSSASEQFKRWSRAGGKVLAGLVRRRLAEASLFLTPDE